MSFGEKYFCICEILCLAKKSKISKKKVAKNFLNKVSSIFLSFSLSVRFAIEVPKISYKIKWSSIGGVILALSGPSVLQCVSGIQTSLTWLKLVKLGKTWLKLWLDFRLEPILTITLEKFRSLQKWSKVTQK